MVFEWDKVLSIIYISYPSFSINLILIVLSSTLENLFPMLGSRVDKMKDFDVEWLWRDRLLR